MEQQQAQLNKLGSWLTEMEQKMKECGGFVAGDVDVVTEQIRKQKALQSQVEEQQDRVNSLQNMVVVVDDTNSESGRCSCVASHCAAFSSACMALEEQLEALGQRWASVCKWTEEHWLLLQEMLTRWQHYNDECRLFSDWLMEKESVLAAMRLVDISELKEVVDQVRQLKVCFTHSRLLWHL